MVEKHRLLQVQVEVSEACLEDVACTDAHLRRASLCPSTMDSRASDRRKAYKTPPVAIDGGRRTQEQRRAQVSALSTPQIHVLELKICRRFLRIKSEYASHHKPHSDAYREHIS